MALGIINDKMGMSELAAVTFTVPILAQCKYLVHQNEIGIQPKLKKIYTVGEYRK